MYRTLWSILLAGCAVTGWLDLARGETCQTCLDKALQTQAEANYDFIGTSWRNYTQATRLLKQLEKTGTAEQITAARSIWEKTNTAWHKAEALARAISDPAFAARLSQERAGMEQRLESARNRQRKEVAMDAQLERAQFGPERKGLLQDISGYEKEARHLQRMAFWDLVSFGVPFGERLTTRALQAAEVASIAKIGSDPMKQAASLMLASVRGLKGQTEAGAAGLTMLLDGRSLHEASAENSKIDTFASSVVLAGDATLRFTALVVESPNGAMFLGSNPAVTTAAHVTPIWLNVAALALDTALVSAAVQRLDNANRRLEVLEIDEAYLRQRIKVSTEIVSRLRRQVQFQDAKIEYQRRITSLYGQIQTEGKQRQ